MNLGEIISLLALFAGVLPMKLLLAALVLCAGLVGCASAPVSIPAVRPAELEMAGLQRIAVPEFLGPAPYAAQARNDLCAALVSDQRCEIPPPHIVRELLPASVPYRGYGIDVPALVQQARRAGFDAILIGELKYRSDVGNQFVLGTPSIEAVVETQLIDTRSGAVRGETTASSDWRGEISSNKSANNTEQKVTQQLVRVCVDTTVHKMTRRNMSIEVTLADPVDGDDEAAMQSGREAAEAGNWPLAAQYFERARAENPSSHAALHNLAVACEAQFDFTAARRWHSEALRLHEAEDYRSALARVDTSWRDYDVAMRSTQPTRLPRIPEHDVRPTYVATGL